MSSSSRRRITITLTLASAVGLSVAGAYFVGDPVAWRAQFVLEKLTGKFPEVTWSESVRWMLPGSPVYLDRLLDDPNPHVALTNSRYVSDEDLAAGRDTYRQHCASCHGGGGEGVAGPPLTQRHRAQSDWAVYRTIERGIPGTAMPAHDLDDVEIWQIITFLSSIAEEDAGGPDPAVAARTVAFEEIVAAAANPADWLTYSGRPEGWRFSGLTDIDRRNAGDLELAWMYQSSTTYNKFQTNPIVVDGVMYITEPPGRIVALNASDGSTLWTFDRMTPTELTLCCGVSNRGVAILNDTVFAATIDAGLVALDAATGRLKWEVDVADHRQGYSITAAPLALPGLIVTGVAGGEIGTRGHVSAYDPATGELQWRFDTIPAPGSAAAETWRTDAWRYGGAATWMTGSYDPSSDILYWGTSHTVHEPDVADPGRKFYGSTILALRGRTGELLWHFQATPNDVHGFDAAQVPLVMDQVIGGERRRVVANANRNGFYYVLDAASGEFLRGEPFAKQTWAKGLDEHGSPIVDPAYKPSASGTLSWPNSVGATNWWPPTYHPGAQLVCLPVVDSPSLYYLQDANYEPGEPYVRVVGEQRLGAPTKRFIRCLAPDGGTQVWEKPLTEQRGNISMAGLLSTAGDVLFAADDHWFLALDVETGQELWRLNTGGSILAAPVTFRSDGRQLVVVASGRTLLAFAVEEEPPSVD